MRRLIVSDRFDNQLFELAEADVFELVRHEVVNGEHSLTITTTAVLESGWRIVHQDDRGYWHEHVVYGMDTLHASGDRPVGTYYCIWSLQYDLMGTRVSAMPGVQSPVTAAEALLSVLEGTSRWQRGTVTDTATGGASMYDMDGWEALTVLIANWGGEVDSTIEVGRSGITARKVDLYAQQGEAEAVRRFDFGDDLKSVRRTVPDGPLYCRITPRGRGEETESGGYGRKVTIESVNDGVDYLEYAPMVDLAKLPDGDGGWEYPTLEVENSDCETPSELLEWAQSAIEDYLVPKVTYSVDVVQLAREGVDLQGVSLGDSVHIVDRKLGLRISARVMEVSADEVAGRVERLTIGGFDQSIGSRLTRLSQQIVSVQSSVDTLGNSLSTADYIGSLLDRINAEINATGGYTYIVPGNGILCFDAAVADPLDPDEASKVVEIKGGSIRIANTRTAQGAWEWKSVFTSGHISSDLVTAAQLVAGYIGNASGTYWDLDNNLLHLPATTIMDETDLGTVLNKVDSTIMGVDVQYAQSQSDTVAPTSGWSATAPAYEAGKYIWQRTATTTPRGTTYSTPVMISGKDGDDGTSVTILGSYNTLAELQAAHPTGSAGDGYIVGGDLYVWDGSQWEDVGSIRGPQGPAGADGEDGSQIWTATSDPTTPNYTFPLSSLTGPDSVSPKVGDLVVRSYYRYTVTSVGSSSVQAGIRTSIRGATGAPGVDGTSVTIQSSTKVGDTTTVVLTDGTTTSTLSIVDGVDGVDGTPGAGGYVHVAWATSADGSEGFSTTDSEDKTYIGVYTDQTQADSTRYQDYSWSLIQGTGVSEIVEQYYLSTSSTTQTGGSWSSSQPIWESGKFIWTRSAVTWTDGTTSYTDPVLAQAVNGANELADEALTEAAKANAMIRAYGDGVLVCRQGNTVGALVNADGSFDVVKVTWSGTTPTASTVYASYGPDSVIGDAAKAHVEISPDYGFGVYGSNPAATGQIVEIGRVGYESRTKPYFTFGTRTSGSTKGTSSVALGWDTAASGNYSLTQGQGTVASGYCSAAFGTHTTASNTAAAAFGTNSKAAGAFSIAMGNGSQTNGQDSFAGGVNSVAGGLASLAFGGGVKTGNYYETVLGSYNVVSTGSYTNKLVVGGGSSDSDRKNILTLDGSGRLTIAGSLVQNSDRRLKQHVSYLGDDASVIIDRLKPAVFVKDGGRHYGFYAQDVQRADIWDTKTVEAQHTDESLDFDPLTLDYTALIAPLVAYAQNLEKRVEQLESRLAAQEGGSE